MKPGDHRDAGAPRSVLLLLCLAFCCAACGCGPSDPLDATVAAGSTLALSMWLAEAQRALTGRQMADFNQAVQEMRFHVMVIGAASGSEAVEEATLRLVDGQTVRHVIQQGLGWELERAEVERATLEAGMRTNARMTTRPGDDDSANYLTDLRSRQVARLKAATDEVNRAREGLAAAGMPVPPAPSPAPDR